MLFGDEGDVIAEPVAQSMTVASSLLTLGVVVVSPLLLDLAGVFAVSEARVGLLVTAFTAPPIVLIPVAGVLADLVGRKPLLVAGIALFGLGGGAIGLTTDFDVVLGLRALQGVGFAMAMPLTITVLGDVYTAGREATVQGFRTAGNFFVNMVAPVVAAVVMGLAWQYPFALFLVVLPVAVWVWVTLEPTAPAMEATLGDYLGALAELVRRPHVLLLLSTFGLRFFVFFGFLTYVSFLGKQTIGMTTVLVGVMTAVKAVASVAGSTQAGRLSLRLHTAAVAVGAFVCTGVGMALAGLFPSVAMLALGSVLLGIGDGVVAPVQKSLVTNLSPAELRAGTISTSSTVQNFGKAVAPVALAGAYASLGPPGVFVLLGVVAFGSAAIMAVVWRLTATVDALA